MTKISELPQTTTMAAGDLLAVVTNPATAPVTNRMTLADFRVLLPLGFATLNALLIDQTAAEAYQLTTSVYFGDGALNTGTVVWPDGSTGAFTTTTHNVGLATVDAYTITHTTSGKTVTQPTVTRDVTGLITTKPALTVTP